MQQPLTMVESLDNETLIHVNLDEDMGAPVIVRQYVHTALKMSDEAGVKWQTSDVHYFDADGLAIKQKT